MSRIPARFADLKKQGRAGLITFITAGDSGPVIDRIKQLGKVARLEVNTAFEALRTSMKSGVEIG